MWKKIKQFFSSFMKDKPIRDPIDELLYYRSFSASQSNDLTYGWVEEHRNLNEIIASDLDKLRNRARVLARNSDYVVRYSTLLEINIVGSKGFILQSKVKDDKGNLDEKLCSFIEEQFKIWCERYCDFTRQQNFNGLCKSLIYSMPFEGEFLVYVVEDNRNPHGISLQRIDVGLIDTKKNQTKTDNSRLVVNGIEVSSGWQRLAIHLRNNFSSANSGEYKSSRLPFDKVIHGFRTISANQTRGVPWIASGMIALHHLQGYMTSAVLAASNGANNSGFIVNSSDLPPHMLKANASAPTPSISQPLKYDVLPSGLDFKQITSQYPTDAFGPFVETMLQRIATGWGISYSSLASDLKSANYSSMRIGLLQERDHYINIQDWFLHSFVDKVFEKWLLSCYSKGLFKKYMRKKYNFGTLLSWDWQARRWDWVDPKNDSDAKIQLVKAGVMPADSLASSMGYDFRDNLVKLAKFKEFASNLGLKIDLFEDKDGKTSKKYNH